MAAVKITTFNANRAASALLPECLEKELPCMTSSNWDALLQLASHLPVIYLWVDVAYEWTLQSLIFQASPRPTAIP